MVLHPLWTFRSRFYRHTHINRTEYTKRVCIITVANLTANRPYDSQTKTLRAPPLPLVIALNNTIQAQRKHLSNLKPTITFMTNNNFYSSALSIWPVIEVHITHTHTRGEYYIRERVEKYHDSVIRRPSFIQTYTLRHPAAAPFTSDVQKSYATVCTRMVAKLFL